MTISMVWIGGLTRLTNSGLSMTTWSISGGMPPLTEASWLEEFSRYQQFPEYKEINQGMSLSAFKSIFWFEYIHRMLGRTIGMVFLLPFLFFLARKAIDRRLGFKLTGLFVLGGMQGLIGWWRVKSGLVDRPDVSQYRLTTHLGMAFLLYCALVWSALSQFKVGMSRKPTEETKTLARLMALLAGLTGITVLSGGLVAGINAGSLFNTFPLIAGQLIPDGLLYFEPWYSNFGEHHLTVQFTHRTLALTTFSVVIGMFLWSQRVPITLRARHAMKGLLAMAIVQVSLGITALLTIVWTPVASAHQLGALGLLTMAIWANHELWRPQSHSE